MKTFDDMRNEVIRGISDAMKTGPTFNAAFIVMIDCRSGNMRFANHIEGDYVDFNKISSNKLSSAILRAAADSLDEERFKTVVTRTKSTEYLLLDIG